jgi:hypothetical protein
VATHLLPLFVIKGPGFPDDARSNTELADVMDSGSEFQELELPGGQLQLMADPEAERGDNECMLFKPRIHGGGLRDQGVDSLAVHAAPLREGHPRGHRIVPSGGSARDEGLPVRDGA